MFNQLRVNSPIYLFHKTLSPRLETGFVQSVSGPRPKYTMPTNMQQTQEYVVDLQVKIGEQVVNYKCLPAQQEVYEFYEGGEPVILSDTKTAINQEIMNHKQRSIDTMNSYDQHKSAVEQCDQIIKSLNPEYAEKEQQREELSSLKDQVELLTKNMEQLMQTNLRLVEQLNHKED